jgi:hypothetical protein
MRNEPQLLAALFRRTVNQPLIYRDLGIVSSLSTPWSRAEVLSQSIARGFQIGKRDDPYGGCLCIRPCRARVSKRRD